MGKRAVPLIGSLSLSLCLSLLQHSSPSLSTSGPCHQDPPNQTSNHLARQTSAGEVSSTIFLHSEQRAIWGMSVPDGMADLGLMIQ